MKILSSFFLVIAISLITAHAQPSDDAPTYDTGFSASMRIGNELYLALKKDRQKLVHTHPVALETDVTPFVKTVEYPDEDKPLRLVFISVGFIDLINNVAHAKAIDKIEPGYFEKYILSLAEETGEMSLKDLPGISNKKYWSEDTMNDQKSNFNQMAGTVIGIELAHHYLGHFKKFTDKLEVDGKPVPMNNLLSGGEWKDSIKEGVHNALECGYGVDGLKSLYDAIDKMPARPLWTAYFLPQKVQVAKVKKDLEKIEDDFFHGK